MQPTLRILLVDDNPHDRGMVRRELRNEFGEIRFKEVINESELAAALARAEFDIVITDYQIRWTNGLNVLRAVRERLPLCPVLMFTATGTEEIAVEAMKAGLDDYIVKNRHHAVRLRGAVRAALDRAETRRRADRIESRLQALLAQLHIGAFHCSLDGRFLDVNPAMISLLGCEREEVAYGMSLASLFADQSEAESFREQIVESGLPQEIEIEVQGPSGESRTFRLCAMRIDHCGKRQWIDGLLEDVTVRRRAERQARQATIAYAQICTLSPRERQVLEEVVAGNSNKNIARHLDISEKTVERHRSHLMKKLNIRSMAALVRLATQAEQALQPISGE